jgi:hypothetical protein
LNGSNRRTPFLIRSDPQLRFDRRQSSLGLGGHRLGQVSQLRNANTVAREVELPPHVVHREAPRSHEPEKQLHVGLEKAQAVGGLDEIGLRPAPDLVRADQSLDLRNQIVIGLLAAEPGADDARAPLRVRPLVLRVDQRLVDWLVGSRERPLHIVCQRRQTDGLGRFGRDPIEPLERLQEMVPVVWILLDHPLARLLDET